MKCEVCGGKIWPDDYLKAYLCAGHLRQAEECINILKGEKGFIPYKEVPSGYGDVPLVEWGASDKPLWVMVSGVKFVPEKPLYAGCYVRREPFLLEEHIVVETRWGDELFDEPVARAALISDALFAYMEKEREG